MARHLHGPAADAVEEFLRTLSRVPPEATADATPDDLGEFTPTARTFEVYEDVNHADVTAFRGEVERFNARIRQFNEDAQRFETAVETYNRAAGELDGIKDRVELVRTNIADHAERIVRVIDGVGGDGGCLLPFVE